MRIDCPSCNAAYDVPPERLAAGRTVKCARCANSWTPVPLEAAVEPVPAAALADPIAEAAPDAALPDPAPLAAVPEAAPVPAEPLIHAAEPRRRSRAPLVAAWLLSIAVLIALGWAAIDRRADVMRAWPPSIRAYAALGLAVPH